MGTYPQGSNVPLFYLPKQCLIVHTAIYTRARGEVVYVLYMLPKGVNSVDVP